MMHRLFAALVTAPFFVSLYANASPFGPQNENGRMVQHVMVVSNGGALCRLFRDGALIGTTEVSADRQHGMGQPTTDVDVTTSKSDILIVCSLGDRAISKTVQFGPVEYIMDSANSCITPEHPSAEDNRIAEECLKRPLSALATVMQYPEIVRLFFQPANPHP